MSKKNWSCSEFADWLRGTAKPYSGTAKEWHDWRKAAKAKKIRYWLAEEGLDYLQNFLFWPCDVINNIQYYIRNRWIYKTHALTSNLQRGQWYDFDMRLLHALFDELVNFVEIEQAWHWMVCLDEEQKKIPWYKKIFRLRLFRDPEKGLEHLRWASELKHDENWRDDKDPNFGQPTLQALTAKETVLLYKWWKEERPKRPDPMDASGWSDYCEEKYKNARLKGEDDLFWDFNDQDEADREHKRKILDLCHGMEQEQMDEDTEMMIRLIKIRNSLWT